MVADRIFPGLITGRTRSRHTCLNPYSITALAASLGKPLCEAHRLSVICVDRRPATSSVTSQVMAIALWPAAPSRSAILRTAGSLISTIHDGQGLPLRLEASNHLARIQPALEQLQSDPAAKGLRLLGDEDNAKNPSPILLKQLIRTNEGAGRLGWASVKDGSGFLRQVEQVAASSVGMRRPLNLGSQGLVIATRLVQECPTLSRGFDLIGPPLPNSNKEPSRPV
jgi:hypothetical protein